MYDLIVVGGGAAGFFGAIQAAEMNPKLRVIILEKSTKLLAKVRISGGGRCNVTHHCYDATKLSRHYPRGEKFLKGVFKKYQAADVVEWFQQKGVRLKVEDDGRMFPTTDNSQTVIDAFLKSASQNNIEIELSASVTSIAGAEEGFDVRCNNGKKYKGKTLLVATGGHPNSISYDFVRALGHTIHSPLPSLFTFNDSGKEYTDLMGVSVPNALVRIAGTKFQQQGAILITHWGLSGPAVIKLSAWAAEYLHEKKYEASVLVSWIGSAKEEETRAFLHHYKASNKKRKVYLHPLFELPQRLWQRLCYAADIDEDKIWNDLSQRSLNKLLEVLIRCPFHIKGKTTFKEEFVTCGGVDLKEINPETMESKMVKGLFFAGEVMNIDGETGGFNFQAAWSTAFVAASCISKIAG